MARYSTTERIGVNAVEHIVLHELGWIFREQPIVDMGIDAHIERVDDGSPTGKLVALQIKTGSSHFHESGDGFVYYGSLTHLDYWSGHSLPVLLVAHFPESNQTLWALVTEGSTARTAKGWKIAIPKANVFGETSRDQLAEIFEGSPAQQRLRKLSIDEPLMRHITDGGKVSVELEEWVNKSLGRTPVQVFIHDKNGNETLSQDWFQYYVGYGVKELAEALFPWATAIVDEEFYEEHADQEEDWRDALSRAIDEDNGIIHGAPDPDAVYPYSESAGEVESYRLELKLNELGKAFLMVSDHLSHDDGIS